MCKAPVGELRHELAGSQRAWFAAALREHGHVATAQRLAVAETLGHPDGHICVEHILAHVDARYAELAMNKTTVYRALDLFVRLGLVKEIACGEERAQYELASRGRHGHLLCPRCGNLLEVDADLAAGLQREIKERHGFVLDVDSHPLVGLCPACAGQPAPAAH